MDPRAVAGLGFAYTYWFLLSGIGLGIAGGTVSLVSQRYGAEKYERIDLVIKQSLCIAILLSIPLTITYWNFADELINLLGAAPTTRQYGRTYLQVLSVGILLQFVNHIASRTLIGADDAWTPMIVRAGGAGLNIIDGSSSLSRLSVHRLRVRSEDSCILGTLVCEVADE